MEHKVKGTIFTILSFLVPITWLLIVLLTLSSTVSSEPMLIVIASLTAIFLFLTAYNFSFAFPEKRKKISLIIAVPALIILLITNFIELKSCTHGACFLIHLVALVSYILITLASVLIAHYYLKFEKIKYSFFSFLVAFITTAIASLISYYLTHVDRITPSLFNIANVFESMFLTSIIFGAIPFVILLVINIVMNKKGAEEATKKKYIFVIPSLIFLALLVAFAVYSFLI
jgi:hypothetical protein